ncbi:hypothetical protein [Parvularcula marina]|uniref:DUF945 domain-containing protein n=1 Tax=Parvularcula marina TaxID=2292771 RepID=A0A371RIH5_9PROT|nr:hypothetical protein [Parvularcula marina]RFB05242.1 hypothetical protein DX908_08220 [Parvularcula marina]
MTNSLKALLLGATASFALVACGGDKDDAKDDAKIEVDGKSMTMKSDSPLDKPFKLSNAEPYDIAALLDGMGGALSYDSADFDGDLGAAVITNLRPASDDGGETSIGRVEIYGLNQEALAGMGSGAGFTDMTELFRKVRMFDVKSTFPVEEGWDGSEPTVGNISIGALEIDTIKMMGTPGGDMGPDSVEFGGLSLKDMSMNVPFSGEGDGVKFATPDFRVAGYKNGVFGGLMAADLSYDIKQSDEMIQEQLAGMGPQAGMLTDIPLLKNMIFPAHQSGKIGMMSWDGLTFTNLIPFIQNGETPPVSETNLIKIGGMKFLDQEVSINGKKAASVESTVVDPIDFHHFMPKKIRIVSKGSKADMTAYVGDENPAITKVLKDNGLDKVNGESELEYSFDPRSGGIKLDMDGEAKGFYGLSLNFAMSDFDYDTIVGAEDEGAKQGAVMNAAIDGMTLKLKDEKLLDTVFAIAGALTEQDPAGLRQQAVGLMSLGAMQGAQFSPRVPEYATALSSFVSEGGTLTISVAPSQPVTIGSLAASGQSNPGAVLDTLNVTVKQD